MASIRASMASGENDWKAKADLETVLEAERIKRDSKRMNAVRKVAKERKEGLEELTEPTHNAKEEVAEKKQLNS